jgi:hypothetical protein
MVVYVEETHNACQKCAVVHASISLNFELDLKRWRYANNGNFDNNFNSPPFTLSHAHLSDLVKLVLESRFSWRLPTPFGSCAKCLDMVLLTGLI